MDESALNPVVQEALGVSRKLARFLQVDATPMTYPEFSQLWEGMTTDRSLVASFIATLVTKCLTLNNYELKLELTESLLNLLTSKPLFPEAEKNRASSSVKNEMKRQMDLKVLVMNTISYVAFLYPMDPNHFAVRKSYTTWLDDLEKNKGARDTFENEVSQLLSAAEKLESEQSIKEFINRCANVASIKQDLVEYYNSFTPPSNKSMSDTFLLANLVWNIQKGTNKALISSTAAQQLGNWAAMTDLKFYSLFTMIKEFLLRDPSIDGKTLQILQDAIKVYITWPSPFCETAIELSSYLDFRRRVPAIASCLNFLQDHPDLQIKSKQEEFVHVIINSESLYGSVLKETLIPQQTPPLHELKSRMLMVFYKFLFEEEQEVYQFLQMDQVIVNQLFTKALEIIAKIVNLNGNISKGNFAPRIKDFKQSIDDHLTSLGAKLPKIPASSISDLDVGCLPFTVVDFEGGELSVQEKGVTLPGTGDEVPDFEGFHTLEKILSQYSSRTSPAKVKIAICGGDTTVSNIINGFTTLKNVKPELFKNLSLSFYLIPTGQRNHLASCLSLFDPWYGRQVLLAMHSVMGVIPNASRMPLLGNARSRSETVLSLPRETFEKRDSQVPSGVPPATFIRNLLDHYLRQASHTVQIRTYWAEVLINTPSNTLIKRLIPFSQSLEIGFGAFNSLNSRIESNTKSGKRNSINLARPSKFAPPEVSVKFTEVDVAGVPHQGPQIASKAYWSIQISNLPRSAEYAEVVKPFSNCLELHLLDLESGRKIRGKSNPLDDGAVHYINQLEVEDASKRTFDLLIDNEPVGGVVRLKVTPAADPSAVPNDPVNPKDCLFPVMAFFPSL